MKRGPYIWFLFIPAVAGWVSCKKAYAPKIVTGKVNYLVVEGFINTGNDSTIIQLSRAVKINSKADSIAENGAIINVEGDDNTSYPLQESRGGKYGSASLQLNNTRQYRLRIKTTDGKEYVSDFTRVKLTPPIDTIGFNILSNGVQVYLNTHDPNKNARYYRWTYQEDWEFHARYASKFISDGHGILDRPADQADFFCYTHDASSNTLLGSSAKLQQDVIYQQPVIFIPSTSEKLETRYSVLVKQYALSTDEYNYWQNLKKNTEQIGSIFDAQPSEIQGNVHCLSDNRISVIGFVGATSIQQKRLFIDNTQLPKWDATYPYACRLDSFLYCRPYMGGCKNEVAQYLIPLPAEYYALNGIYGSGGLTIGFTASDKLCSDCTVRGSKTPPDFWR